MERSEPVRLGVVGGGLVSQVVHLPELAALRDRFAIVALAEPSPRVRAALATRYGIARPYADHRALLHDGEVDALLVCSPNGTHAAVALDALDAGLHVLVEKPLCIDPADGERIAAAAGAAGLVAQVGYMKRFDPAYEALLEDLPAAAPLLHVTTETYDPGLRAPFAPSDMVAGTDVPAAERSALAEATADQVARAIGTDAPEHAGALSDVFLGALVHDVNLVRGILDRVGAGTDGPLDAFAASSPARGGGTVELSGGARWTLVWLHVPGLEDFCERVAVYTRDAVRTLEFPAPYLRQAPTVYRRSTGGAGRNEQAVVRSWQEAYRRQLLHFHACITAGAPCRAPAADAVADVRLLVDLYRRTLTRGGERGHVAATEPGPRRLSPGGMAA